MTSFAKMPPSIASVTLQPDPGAGPCAMPPVDSLVSLVAATVAARGLLA